VKQLLGVECTGCYPRWRSTRSRVATGLSPRELSCDGAATADAVQRGFRSVRVAASDLPKLFRCRSGGVEGVCPPRERDTNVLVMAAVMTVRKPIPTSMTSDATSLPATVAGTLVAVPDRRDGLYGPPESGSDRRKALWSATVIRMPASDRDRGRHRGDHDSSSSRPRGVGQDAVEPPSSVSLPVTTSSSRSRMSVLPPWRVYCGWTQR